MKSNAHIDNDTFTVGYNAIIETILDEQILEKILDAVDKVAEMSKCDAEAKALKKSLEFQTATFDECIDFIQEQVKDNDKFLS